MKHVKAFVGVVCYGDAGETGVGREGRRSERLNCIICVLARKRTKACMLGLRIFEVGRRVGDGRRRLGEVFALHA